MFFLSTLSSMALVAVSVTSIAASPLSPRATPSCYGITGPFFINGKSYALDGQTVSSPVVVSGTTNLSAIWYANGHGGAPCDSGFALGITKDSLSNAPKTLLSSDWQNDLSINGPQASLIRIDANRFQYGNYTAWFVQYDPSNGNVLSQSNRLPLFIDSVYGRPNPSS